MNGILLFLGKTTTSAKTDGCKEYMPTDPTEITDEMVSSEGNLEPGSKTTDIGPGGDPLKVREGTKVTIKLLYPAWIEKFTLTGVFGSAIVTLTRKDGTKEVETVKPDQSITTNMNDQFATITIEPLPAIKDQVMELDASLLVCLKRKFKPLI